MDLGAAWNGFSLNEQGELSASIEKTGQAIDSTYMSTTRLVSLGSSFTMARLNTFPLVARSRAELAGAPARVLAIRVDHQKAACVSAPETRPAGNDAGFAGVST